MAGPRRLFGRRRRAAVLAFGLPLWACGEAAAPASDAGSGDAGLNDSAGGDAGPWIVELPGHESDEYFEFARTVAVDAEGNAYVGIGGWQRASPRTGTDWWLKKFDPRGDEVTTGWDKVLDTCECVPRYEAPFHSLMAPDGDVVFVGRARPPRAERLVVHRYRPDGAPAPGWQDPEADGYLPVASAMDPQGRLYLAATAYTAEFQSMGFLRRHRPDGTPDPTFEVSVKYPQQVEAIELGRDGSVYVFGTKGAVNSLAPAGWLTRYSDTAEVVWSTPVAFSAPATYVLGVMDVGPRVLTFEYDEATGQFTVHGFATADGRPDDAAWRPFRQDVAVALMYPPRPVRAPDDTVVLISREASADPDAPDSRHSALVRRFDADGTPRDASTRLSVDGFVFRAAVDARGRVLLVGGGWAGPGPHAPAPGPFIARLE